uniref:Reverse transcriptase domain-containing protein n=1 Tax=Cannabis sativa TaxID=3483 RepID=A0A803NYG4_CANSA
MHPDKAPGPDGMGPGFYQHHWDIVSTDLIALVSDFFNTGTFPSEYNTTNLVLIPKKKNFSTMGDLRPIALCNVAYKISAKVLANRMRPLIGDVISETQSAFIPGRLISDNIMVAFEVMHYLKRKRRGKRVHGHLSDMSKAYDRVEWDYLRAVMLRMGFAERWVNLVMECVTTVTYTIVHNNHSMGPIIPTRGIRQGDPLSTYLFIICAEGFSSIIQKFVANQLIQGCRVANGAPAISHMLFADDSYLFCQATNAAALNVRTMLHSFEMASGQKVNVTKSSIFFSPNTDQLLKNQICSTLEMTEADDQSMYLGLPSTMGRKKTAILGFLKTKMAVHKDFGGLGFRRLHDFNLAMLAKQGWRLLVTPNSLVSQVYKAKYFPRSDFLGAELGNNPSFIWRSIWQAKDIVKLGARRTIGSGTTASILSHPWLPDNSNPYVTTTHPSLLNRMVNSLFEMDATSWDRDLVTDIFNMRDASLIFGLPLSASAGDDCWSWSEESNGTFSVKSAYFLMQKTKNQHVGADNSGFWRSLWKLKIPPKVKNFMWRLVSNTLPTCLQLITKHVDISSNCPVCKCHPESASHAIISCSFASSCWQYAHPTVAIVSNTTAGTWLCNVFQTSDVETKCRIAMLCWAIWQARNSLVWNKKVSSPQRVSSSALSTLDQWRKAQDKQNLLSSVLETNVSKVEQWTKPESHTIKINVDAALFEGEGSYGYGIVARNSSGLLLDALAVCNRGSFLPEVVEAIGVKEALSWIKTKGWGKVEIETDSMLTVQAIRTSHTMSSVFGVVVNDCKHLLSSSPHVSVNFIKRSANRVAHYVARHSRFFFWL